MEKVKCHIHLTGITLSPLLFLIYINDLKNAIAHSMVHHFPDDTNITFSHKSLKKFNKFINHGLSLLVKWFWANRISLNTSKTEIILFWRKNKNITKNLNLLKNLKYYQELVGKKQIQLTKQNTLAYIWMKVWYGNFRLNRSKAN